MLTLQDHYDITQVLFRYGTGIDTRNWTLFETCFAPDVLAEYGDFGTWRSAGEITEFMRNVHLAVGATLHRMSNIVIEHSATGATSRTYIDALLTPLEADGDVHRGIGYYDDIWVKTGTDWKIKQRRFVSVRLT
ncbi:MAG: hypothetical protein JWM78_2086 [Verrucomicrobiaceae bacterium]|nr:hypothetical protein [Verrucomicrobiaceae bacterium]